MNKREKLAEKLRKEFVENSYLYGQYAEAFQKVPRHQFVPDNFSLKEIYSNDSLVIKNEDGVRITSSSQPLLMANMFIQLSVRPGHKVLEIGTGTGYNAALLAELTGSDENIYTVEINEAVAQMAQNNLAKTQYANVHVITGDGSKGYAPGAPYDRIIVTTATVDFPTDWLAQLDDGGILIAPFSILSCRVKREHIVRLRHRSGRFLGTFGPSWVSFIPMIGEGQDLFNEKQLSKPANELIQFLSERQDTLALDVDIFIFCKVCEAIQSNLFDSEDPFKGDEILIRLWLNKITDEWSNDAVSPSARDYKIEVFPNEVSISKSDYRFILKRHHCQIVVDY